MGKQSESQGAAPKGAGGGRVELPRKAATDAGSRRMPTLRSERYWRAMTRGDLDTCIRIEKESGLYGYPPELVSVGLLAIEAGRNKDEAIEEYRRAPLGHTEIGIEDFAGMNEYAIKDKIADDFGIARSDLDAIEIVVAYMSVGSWGCDSGAFIVFRKDGALYEVNGSHCSCHGFNEDSYSGGGTQWRPELVPDVAAIIQREDWALACGGYDRDKAGNATAIRAALAPFQTGGAE